MKNPILAFIKDNEISTAELARRTDMKQPTVYRHAYNDQYLSYASMEAYASVGISWDDLRAWQNHLLHKKQDQQGGNNVSSRSGGSPPGGEDI